MYLKCSVCNFFKKVLGFPIVGDYSSIMLSNSNLYRFLVFENFRKKSTITITDFLSLCGFLGSESILCVSAPTYF